MTQPFMRAYTERLVRACHRGGAMLIGGPTAFVPNRRNPAMNSEALLKTRIKTTREAIDGFDGAWVAHADLVPAVREVFDAVLGQKPSQIDGGDSGRHRDGPQVSGRRGAAHGCQEAPRRG